MSYRNGDVAEKLQRHESVSKDAIALRKTSIRLVPNVLLIWLDSNIDKNNETSPETMMQLRRIINTVQVFSDVDRCFDFLTDHADEKVFMIIVGLLCEKIISSVHDITQLHTMFIFAENDEHHEQWIQEWPKIKGVFGQITAICEALKEAVEQCEQNAIPISFVNTNDDLLKTNFAQLDSLFMYTQILKEILLTIDSDEKSIKEFLAYARDVFAENAGGLLDTDGMNRKYHDRTPIWWYTRERFLYSTLNYALRRMDVDVIIKMSCFVRDLHHQIEQLHTNEFSSEQSGKVFKVYRGQGMSRTDFSQLMQTKGGLMSFNSFLSTSKDRHVSLIFAESNSTNPDLVGVLFVMTIDLSKSTTPFASVRGVSYYEEEEEVLFSMHTIFRICESKPIDENPRLYQVDLTLTNDTEKDFRALTDRIRKDIFPDSSGWYRLGLFLIQIGRVDKAQQLYEVMLDQTVNESEKGSIYNQIGLIKARQGEYQEAITFYQRALDTYQRILSK